MHSDVPRILVLDKLKGMPYRAIETGWEELTNTIMTLDSMKYEYYDTLSAQYHGSLGLKIDRDTPMKCVKELKRKLATAGIFRVVFSVLPRDLDGYTKRSYEDRSPFGGIIHPYFAEQESYEAQLSEMNDYFIPVKVSHSADNMYIVDGKKYDIGGFRDKMYEVMCDANYVIAYDIADDITYQDYINVIGNIKLAVEQHRREYIELSLSHSSEQSRDELYNDAMKIYPLRIFELLY